jgi:FAD/FMN-containing dehydrogenase
MQKNFTQLENFGHSLSAPSYLIKPTTTDEINEAFSLAKKSGIAISARGAGRSYNDAALIGGGIMLDMCGMNAITEWDPATGLITAQPGVAACCFWHHDNNFGGLPCRKHSWQK